MSFNWRLNSLLCDWTEYQGALDASRVEAEGFAGVLLKASGRTKRGTSAADGFYADPMFERNAAALMGSSSMLRGAYHYLVPSYPSAQAGILYDRLRAVGGYQGWMVEVDAEEAGLTAKDVLDFVEAWMSLTSAYPIIIYTRRNLWKEWGDVRFGYGGSGKLFLHIARYVSKELRFGEATPYASQQVAGVGGTD